MKPMLRVAGSAAGGGDVPAHFSAWCKSQQGWVTTVNQTQNATIRIEDVRTSHKVYRLWTNGALGQEYFLVENRQLGGYDAKLPGPGLLIWHVDDAVAGNSNDAHPQVKLLQADGLDQLKATPGGTRSCRSPTSGRPPRRSPPR